MRPRSHSVRPVFTGVFTALFSFLLMLPYPAQAEEPKPVKVLYVGGGCCHDYEVQKELIKTGLEERALAEVTVVVQGGDATDSKIPLYESASWAEGYDVVIHHECFAAVKEKEWVDNILKPHRDGLPAVVVHCAMHCYRTGEDDWFKFCGVTSRRHGKHYGHDVTPAAPEHPIMEGFPKVWQNPVGELYWIEKLWDTATPLATSKNQENGNLETSVWTNLYEGKTRVFGTTLGHHNETVASPEFLNLLARGTLWAADKLDEAHLKVPEPKLVRVNLALGQPATASSEETNKGNLIAKAFDGDPGTRWCAANSSAPQWLAVDLTKPQKVTGVRLDWESKGNAYRHTIEVSADGKEWKTAVDAADQDKPGAVDHDFEAPGARFVRVTFLGSSGGGWGSIREFEVYGEKTVPAGSGTQAASALTAQEKELLDTMKVPEGFDATIFSAPPRTNYPTFVKATGAGDVFVSIDKNGSLARDPHQGSIQLLRDTDGDGKADVATAFVADVDAPRGLEWDGEWLYCVHPPDLSAYRDTDGDGVADESRDLIKGIAFGYEDRPADHTTNGTTLGVDGWLYIAGGDFGFMHAVGADGTELARRGGGVLRIRPDGSGLHQFSIGTRNIYKTAVGPLLNAFSRDNTNDGGGWDVRLHHFTGLENHGYPQLYMHFNEQIVQPLADFGGGSGTGALFLAEPGFPRDTGHSVLTVDWGKNFVYRQLLEPAGATFKSVDQEEFIGVPRPTDIDVDGSGHLFVASWKDGRFKYDGENIGFLARVTPRGGTGAPPFPNLKKAKDGELVGLLGSPSLKRRLLAQQELLRRGNAVSSKDREALEKKIADPKAWPLESRVAGLFTLAQLSAEADLAPYAQDAALREFALRALGDRNPDAVSEDALTPYLTGNDPRVRLQALVSLGRLNKTAAGPDILPLTADPDPVIAHTAVRVLSKIEADDACLAEVMAEGSYADGALYALQARHTLEVVTELGKALDSVKSTEVRKGILRTLARLYYQEGPWDGSSWGTRPDTTGPYYNRVTWEGSEAVGALLKKALGSSATDQKDLFAEMARNQIDLDDSLPTVLSLAEKDPSAEPTLVAMMLKKGETPEQAVPALTRIANAEDRPGELRLGAAQALANANSDAAAKTALEMIVKENSIEAIPHARNHLNDAFYANHYHENRYEWLIETAQGEDDARGVVAYTTLVFLLNQPKLAPETRGEVERAIAAATEDKTLHLRLLKGIQSSKHQPSAPLVIAAAKSEDKDIRKAAERAAGSLKIDLKAAASNEPKIAVMKPEDVVAAVLKVPGDPALGEALFTRQTCVTCHTVDPDEPLKGPFLGNITSIYQRKELAEAVLNPGATIAQGFATNVIQTKDGQTYLGFVSKESADQVELRDITGNVNVIDVANIKERTVTEISVMPPGLAATLTVKEFASLLAYLESLNKAQ